MQAGPRVALVDVMLAVAAREARRTQAGEGVDTVHTGAAIEAGAGDPQGAGEKGERGCGTLPGQLPPTRLKGEGPDSRGGGSGLANLREAPNTGPGTSGSPTT